MKLSIDIFLLLFFFIVLVKAQIWYCFEHGKGLDQSYFTKHRSAINGTIFFVGHGDVQDTFLAGHHRNGMFVFTTNFLFHKKIWYSAIHSFQGPFPFSGELGPGFLEKVFPDKIGWLTKPTVEDFRSCKTNFAKPEYANNFPEISKFGRMEKCFRYDGNERKFKFQFTEKDKLGNSHFIGYSTGGDSNAIMYGYYIPAQDVYTFHIFYEETSSNAGKVSVVQWTGNFKQGLVYNVAYPNMEIEFPNFSKC